MLKLKFHDYRISNDERQFILSKVRRDETGEIKFTKEGDESVKILGYYSINRPEVLLRAIEHDMIYNDETVITDLNQLVSRYKTVIRQLNDVNSELLRNVRGEP